MSLETRPGIGGLDLSTATKPDKVFPMFEDYQSPGKIERLLNHTENKLTSLMTYEFPQDYRLITLEKAKDPRIIPFIYSNHYDLANGLPLGYTAKNYVDIANTVRDPNDPFLGFVMGVSSTLFDGKQGQFMQDMIRQLKIDFLHKYNTNVIGCTTKNDVEKRGIKSQERTTLLRMAISFARAGNGGIALFPEASVEGGRRFEDGAHKGQRKGLQEFDEDIIQIIRAVAKYDRELLYIPLGLTGPNIIHTDHRRPTVTAIKTLASRHPKPIIHVRVGKPTTQTELLTELTLTNGGKEITDHDVILGLRGMVARLLPQDFLPPTEKR